MSLCSMLACGVLSCTCHWHQLLAGVRESTGHVLPSLSAQKPFTSLDCIN